MEDLMRKVNMFLIEWCGVIPPTAAAHYYSETLAPGWQPLLNLSQTLVK